MKIRKIYVLLFTLLALSCEKDKIENPLVEELTTIRGYSNFYLDTFRCGVFVPASYTKAKKYPLVIYLHGYTDTVTWNLEWYKEPVISTDPCIVLTPKCPKDEIYGWGDSFDPGTSPMMAKTYEMINLAKEAFNLDRDRYYIYGVSMGGYGTYGAIQKNPDLFTAAYVKCGGGNPEMANLLVDFPLWIFHGELDQSVPVHWSRDMYNAIKGLGGSQVKYSEYKGVGHNVWDYRRNEVFWLLAQRKGAVHGKPDAPLNFNGTINNENQISLSWAPPLNTSDNDNQIWYYNIYRDNEIIKEVDSPLTGFTDLSAEIRNNYTYQISAVNFFFRESVVTSIMDLKIND